VLALGEKALEPRFRLRGCVGVRHADDIEALFTRRADERGFEGGGAF
jgi:hypothetical protein